MIVSREENSYYIISCERCGAEIKKHKSYVKRYGDEYHFNPELKCSCGNSTKIAYNKFASTPASQAPAINDLNNNPDVIHCPKCGSTQISSDKKGFSAGKALVGGIVALPISGLAGALVGGLAGHNKIIITCLKCSHKWEAGKK